MFSLRILTMMPLCLARVCLFGEGLGLDSIDALELIVMMEKSYGIKIKDPAAGKEIFKSINTMAAFVEANRTK